MIDARMGRATMDIIKITPQIKDYDWGNINFIPSLLGIPADGRPKAEVWFGTHPAGESTVPEYGDMPLGRFLAEHAAVYFGQSHLERFGAVLPLLFKVLAIDKPLSIQCHPSSSQAEEGFAKEEPLHRLLPRDEWNYKDPNRKAEVIYAMTPLTAMCGFRPLAQIDAALRLLIPVSYEKFFPEIFTGAASAIETHDNRGCDRLIAALFERLYTLDVASLKGCLDEYLKSLRQHDEFPLATADGRFLESRGIALSCAAEYPTDPGLFCPFLLNVMHLEPGEALFLQPKTLHAYAYGNGIELMSASDNVLRGGLTHKKVDVPELMKVLQIESGIPERTPTVVGAFGRKIILTPTEEFVLLTMDSGYYNIDRHDMIELMLCTEGHASIVASDGTFELEKGECCVIAATVPGYRLEVREGGTVFSATVPA